MPPSSPRSPNRALRARDAGLRKVALATRVLVVGSIAAAGAFASMAAWAQPGRSKAAPATNPTGRQSFAGTSPGTGASTATVPVTTPPTVATDDGGGGDLAPPATVPTPAPVPDYQYPTPSYQYSPPVAVSGAS